MEDWNVKHHYRINTDNVTEAIRLLSEQLAADPELLSVGEFKATTKDGSMRVTFRRLPTYIPPTLDRRNGW